MKRLCGTRSGSLLEINDIKDLFNEDVHVEDLYSEVSALWNEIGKT